MRRAILLFGIVLLLCVGAVALTRSSVFALKDLTVSGAGNAFVTERSLALSQKTSLLVVSKRAVAARAVAADPWARQAQVTVVLPHTMDIRMVPRVPVALAQSGTVAWAMTAAGMVLPATQAERQSLPYVTGVPAPSVSLIVDRNPAMLRALTVAKALPASARGQVSEVHARVGGQAYELVLMDGRPVQIGPAVDLGAKLRLLPVLLRRYPWPEYAGTGFDLRDPERPSLYSIGR